jgi:hypothetical protein
MTERKEIAPLRPPPSTLPEELEKFELRMLEAKKIEQQAELFAKGNLKARDSLPPAESEVSRGR